jgi:hypothetical protein
LRLFEHDRFADLLRDAGRHFAKVLLREIPPGIATANEVARFVEKDYYLTEMLRVLQLAEGDAVILKGGTSLMKGWGLISRFSEDVDLFIDPAAFQPPLGGKAMRTKLRSVFDLVSSKLPLERRTSPAYAKRGVARKEYMRYRSAIAGIRSLEPEVCLAAGIGSGREPIARVPIRSLLAEYIDEARLEIGSPDCETFVMQLLHYRRTFVEKLFAIHAAVEERRYPGEPIGPLARHYFDLMLLADQPEVEEMLRGPEYHAIVRDCLDIDHRYYGRPKHDESAWSFRESAALFPSEELSESLRRDYESQCAVLCFGAYPPWKEVIARFESLRHWL